MILSAFAATSRPALQLLATPPYWECTIEREIDCPGFRIDAERVHAQQRLFETVEEWHTQLLVRDVHESDFFFSAIINFCNAAVTMHITQKLTKNDLVCCGSLC